MQVVIDSGSIAFAADDVFDLGGGDEQVFRVIDSDGTVVDNAAGTGSTFYVSTPVPAGGTGRSLSNMRVRPTTAAGYVAGRFYNIVVETWNPPSTSMGWHVFGPFQVISATTGVLTSTQNTYLSRIYTAIQTLRRQR